MRSSPIWCGPLRSEKSPQLAKDCGKSSWICEFWSETLLHSLKTTVSAFPCDSGHFPLRSECDKCAIEFGLGSLQTKKYFRLPKSHRVVL